MQVKTGDNLYKTPILIGHPHNIFPSCSKIVQSNTPLQHEFVAIVLDLLVVACNVLITRQVRVYFSQIRSTELTEQVYSPCQPHCQHVTAAATPKVPRDAHRRAEKAATRPRSIECTPQDLSSRCSSDPWSSAHRIHCGRQLRSHSNQKSTYLFGPYHKMDKTD